jgi:hypothetical protein
LPCLPGCFLEVGFGLAGLDTLLVGTLEIKALKLFEERELPKESLLRKYNSSFY